MTAATDGSPEADARVLVVDDSAINVRLLTTILTRSAVGVIEGITDSSEVMDRVCSFEPDLVVLDLHMPEPDGLTMVFQPVVKLAPDLTAGYDALARFSPGQGFHLGRPGTLPASGSTLAPRVGVPEWSATQRHHNLCTTAVTHACPISDGAR